MRESSTSVLDLPVVDVVVRGAVATNEMTDAALAVARTIADVAQPLRDARVRISQYRARVPFAVVQANVAVAERLVRAQSTAPTVTEAADHATDRLRHRLNLMRRHLAAEEAGRLAFMGAEWPRTPSALPLSRPPSDPVRTPPLVRSKSFPLAVQNPAAARLTMELRDYDFHLFIDDTTETESVVCRSCGPTGYGLLRLAGTEHTVGTIPRTVPHHPAPMLAVRDAIERLTTAPSQRFLFFADPRTGRGRVLYRRYDGNLGLITPAW